MKPDYRVAMAERPAASETLPTLEQRLTERLLAFDRLDEAWPKGRGGYEAARSVTIRNILGVLKPTLRAETPASLAPFLIFLAGCGISAPPSKPLDFLGFVVGLEASTALETVL